MKRFLRVLLQTFIVTICVIVLIGSTCAAVLIYGPSEDLRDLWITTAMSTFTHQYLATAIFPSEYINEVVNRNIAVEPGGEVDTSLIHIADKGDDDSSDGSSGAEEPSVNEKEEIVGDTIWWEDCSSSSFKAYMLVCRDPSLVKLAVTSKLGTRGQTLTDLCEASGAVAGVNAGGFEDDGGVGTGGRPMGIVIKDGEVVYEDRKGDKYSVIGFDSDDKLVLGKFTAAECLAKGIRDAVEFSPFLIVNGEAAKTGSSLHPRTAIGQKADGTVLMLTIDGRSLTSIGAYQSDVIAIMQQYGAVNCGLLDGGSSSTFVYEGDVVNVPSTPMGQRYLPDAFVVMPPS